MFSSFAFCHTDWHISPLDPLSCWLPFCIPSSICLLLNNPDNTDKKRKTFTQTHIFLRLYLKSRQISIYVWHENFGNCVRQILFVIALSGFEMFHLYLSTWWYMHASLYLWLSECLHIFCFILFCLFVTFSYRSFVRRFVHLICIFFFNWIPPTHHTILNILQAAHPSNKRLNENDGKAPKIEWYCMFQW